MDQTSRLKEEKDRTKRRKGQKTNSSQDKASDSQGHVGADVGGYVDTEVLLLARQVEGDVVHVPGVLRLVAQLAPVQGPQARLAVDDVAGVEGDHLVAGGEKEEGMRRKGGEVSEEERRRKRRGEEKERRRKRRGEEKERRRKRRGEEKERKRRGGLEEEEEPTSPWATGLRRKRPCCAPGRSEGSTSTVASSRGSLRVGATPKE